MNLREIIRATHHFSSLTDEQVERLLSVSVKTELKKGATLVRGGQKSDHIYLVARGLLRLDAEHSSGKSCTVVFIPPGLATDGELSGRALSTVTASAFMDSFVLQVPRALVRELMMENPLFMNDFMRERDFTMRYVVHFYSSLISTTPNVRLAKLLLTLTSLLRKENESTDLDLSNEDLASMLGCSRQTTGKVIKEWRSKNLIETAYRKIRITDADAMCAIAGWSGAHWRGSEAPPGSWFYRLKILPASEDAYSGND